MNEFELIAKLQAHACAADPNILIDIGDDAAAVRLKQDTLVISTDSMVQGVHFFAQTPAEAVGYKLLQMNLSDLVAMGASGDYATLNLSMPQLDESWLDAFFKGLYGALSASNMRLIGGNTCAASEINLSLTVFGATDNTPIRRDGAVAGDRILISGQVGAAAAALAVLQASDDAEREKDAPQYAPWLRPKARVDLLGSVLRAHAAVDLSDGLVADLGTLCAASGVSACLDTDTVPLAATASLAQGLYGGEDYQLLLAWPHEATPEGFSNIGYFMEAAGTPSVFDAQGEGLAVKGWDHFE